MRARAALTHTRLAFVASALVVAGACAGEPPGSPKELLDGTPAAVPRVSLEGVDAPAILTKAVLEPRTAVRPRSCLEAWPTADPASHSVARIGVHGESVTLRVDSGRAVLACDDSGASRGTARRWCGAAHGAVRRGRLADPRLDLLCPSTDGAPVAFAWIQPSPRSRYVVVRQDGFAEVYEVVGSLPVRVTTTTAIDVRAATATFDVSEHRADGSLVRRALVTARVSG